jgi:L-amino acid N-acyltransferase YncA
LNVERGAASLPIRLADAADAGAVHAIYAPIVENTVISFEWEVPTVVELQGRMERVLAEGYPWLVAEAGGEVGGYAYATSFRARAAYAWAAEVSVYVHPAHRRRGVGRALYRTLLRLLERQGFRSAYAVATAPNPGSEALHRALGFREVGRFPRIGYKRGGWHDVVCWWLPLDVGDGEPAAIRPVRDVLRDGGTI